MQDGLKLVADLGAFLGEGPCWDPDNGLLYWVDIANCKVHIHDPDKKTNRAIDVGQKVGCVVLCRSGGAMLALEHGFYLLDLDNDKTRQVADPESHLPANRFNDGKCDCMGRLWAGTLLMDQSDKRAAGAGTLYCMDADYSVRPMLRGVTISNGITWSPDNRTMYFIDTPTMKVDAFDFDSKTGNIGNRRTVVEFPDGGGIPDGMTSDSEGMLWVAMWDGHCVSRWDPRTGEQIGKIELPVSGTTSCIFGGATLDELYITTANNDKDKEIPVRTPAVYLR